MAPVLGLQRLKVFFSERMERVEGVMAFIDGGEEVGVAVCG
jgi:hypothetical protein